MLKYILHGENSVLSRNQLNDLIIQAKKQNQEIIKLDGLLINLNELVVNLQTNSLFGQEKLILIERLFSRPKSKEKQELINYLFSKTNFTSIILWEPKPLTKASLKNFTGWQIKEFKIPALVFKFLDSFYPLNQKYLLSLIFELKNQDDEFIFYMLCRRISLLLIAKDLGNKALKIAPWQKYQLLSQAKKFSLEQLTRLYRQLLRIDIKIKTGQTLLTLKNELDLLIINM